jgi:hypothetical protein
MENAGLVYHLPGGMIGGTGGGVTCGGNITGGITAADATGWLALDWITLMTTLLVWLPPALVAVIVYVRVEPGDTTSLPLSDTLPTLLLIIMAVALATFHLRTALEPT